MTAQELYGVLAKKVGFEVVTANHTGNQLRIVGRVPSAGMPSWLRVMESLLTSMEMASWKADISKQYFMRGEKLLYGWRVIFQGENLDQYLDPIARVILGAQVVSRQLDEVPLNVGPDRNALRAGKGAQPIHSAVVGPLAMRTLPTGG